MYLENTNIIVKYASEDTERNNRIWFSIGDFSGILGPAAWERRGTSPLTLLPQYTSLLWVSSMELRKHIVDLKGQQEDSIGGAHRSRLRKAVAAPILTRPPSVPIGFVPQKSHSQAGLARLSLLYCLLYWYNSTHCLRWKKRQTLQTRLCYFLGPESGKLCVKSALLTLLSTPELSAPVLSA